MFFENLVWSPRDKRALKKILLALFILFLGLLGPFGSPVREALFIGAYFLVGFKVLKDAFYHMGHGQVFDENFLMAIATLGALALGDYVEALMVMVFYAIGELFESLALGKSRQSIASLLDYAPEEARVLRGGREEIVDPEEVDLEEVILVYPGEKIPLDGEIIGGKSSLNLAFLTGESLPVEVQEGEEVPSGAINLTGPLKIQVKKLFDESTVAKILELLEEATEKKSVLENFISRFARYYTPVVVFMALAVGILPPLLMGGTWALWIQRALIFLVVSCPCALVISVPLTFFGGIGRASRQGILVKGSNFLEALARVKTLVFDKTGTLTQGDFSLVDVRSYGDREDWPLYGASLEAYSNHPIAQSIVRAYGSPFYEDLSQVEEVHGMGLKGRLRGEEVLVGNKRLMAAHGLEAPALEGVGTGVYVALGGQIQGSFLIADRLKASSKKALEDLRGQGVHRQILLTGDREPVAKDLGQKLGLDPVYAELLPQDKVRIFEDILSQEKPGDLVAYVGDGINDAPVLGRAHVGIAMGSLGSDAAIEAADIVLMDDDLEGLVLARSIAKKTLRIAQQNIALSLVIKLGVMVLSVFGLATMVMAIFADVGVMIIAVVNAMRTLK